MKLIAEIDSRYVQLFIRLIMPGRSDDEVGYHRLDPTQLGTRKMELVLADLV